MYPPEPGQIAGPLTPYGEAQSKQRRLDITLRQNIDAQIELAEKHVTTLKAAKERLETSGILDARIDDIQAAMRW